MPPKPPKLDKKIHIDLSEIDIETILRALGEMQQRKWDKGENSQAVQYVIDRLYRAMGIRLDK